MWAILRALAGDGQELATRRENFNVMVRTDDEGHFIWPGFGDNMRVLMWILKRCKGEAEAVETAIGYEPKPEDIDITGLDGVTVDTIKGLLDVDKELWLEDVKGVEELYAQIGDHVPAELHAEAAALRERLSK
jgi:phosphoenolpyruvate carboxykinase (GTP)